ncbi:MAG: TonB-dependent receptor [Chitinophagaceae bacterium]|nr:MAG: TonB-dependent receptor [Chitinophagaceae bacterium]
MFKRIFIFSFIVLTCFTSDAWGQFTVSGKVISSRLKPVAFASVTIPSLDLSAGANDKGEFIFQKLPAGKFTIQISCLGFARRSFDIEVKQNIADLIFKLEELDLTLKEVVVTANRNTNTLSTSYIMDRTALDHMQMLSVADVTSLLPGGKTNRNLHLATASSQPISINGSTGEKGNPLFGVAVELDGVRLSNTSTPGVIGTDTRNIASSNIESVEIVTGLPSVEYSDLTNGLVKINTRKGKSPFILELMTKPNTKQVALSKGVELGPDAGVLSMNLEHTQSISDIASPYTSYKRNNLGINYSNVLNRKTGRPLFLEIGLNGNIGGYNSKSDPDQFVNTYDKSKDNALRGNLSLKWQTNKPWLTSIEATGTFNFNNRTTEISSNQSVSASSAAIHAMQEGYYVGQRYIDNPSAEIILIDPGYWYQLGFNEDKSNNYSARLKANWNRQFNNINNHLLIGGEWTSSSNSGRGTYYADMRYAPTWRPYPYSDLPAIRNYALFAEDRVHVRFPHSSLRLMAGLRSDITAIAGSEYNNLNSLSPRFTAEYSFFEKVHQKLSELRLRVSWGKTVKLPSFSILYPQVNYRDILAFAPGTTADGKTFYAYYSTPNTPLYNPGLKWQQNTLREINLEGTISGVKIMITASLDKTNNPYTSTNTYSSFTYKFTDQSNLEDLPIPVADRLYSIDKATGIVTVSDRTGAYPSQTVSYREITRGISSNKPANGSPVTRKKLSWIVDFKQMPSIKTAFRVDGNYYHYKGLEQLTTAYMPNSTITMANGEPYKYIGFFVGGALSANGSVRKSVDLNLTSTTHIPSLRLIFTARLECSLYDFSQYLSNYGSGGQRGFVLDSRDAYTPSGTKSDIYAGDQFVGLYPEYYISFDDMQTRVPFAEKFLWAKDNDPALYNELAKMVIRTNYSYYFNPSRISFYYSANLGITKELGRAVSLTFNAINFINNMAQVRSTQFNGSSSLFGSSYIPAFYYGLSFRLKI